jgi:hypothetical protein
MPMYVTDTDPIILYENEGFKICQYRSNVRPIIWHWCENRSMDNEVFRVLRQHDGNWYCTHCCTPCPDDVLTIWILMDGQKPSIRYYDQVKFTGLSEAV